VLQRRCAVGGGATRSRRYRFDRVPAAGGRRRAFADGVGHRTQHAAFGLQSLIRNLARTGRRPTQQSWLNTHVWKEVAHVQALSVLDELERAVQISSSLLIRAMATRQRYGFCGNPVCSPSSWLVWRCWMAACRSFRSQWILLMPTYMSAVPRSTGAPCWAASCNACSWVRIASRRRPCAIRISASARVHPAASAWCPARRKLALPAAYD
jgi:hypothetical protein